MRHFVTAAVVVLLLGSATSVVAGAKEDLTHAAQEWLQAWHEGNVDRITGLYADDAQYFSALSTFRVDGRPAIQTTWTGIFTTFPTRRVVLRHESVQEYGDTTGIWSAYYQAVVTDRAGKVTTLLGRFSATWVKQGGRWIIVHHHFSALPSPS